MLDADLVTTVVSGAMAACATMFVTGTGALAKLYIDVKSVVRQQKLDMEYIQKQLTDCHNDKNRIYDVLAEHDIKIKRNDKQQENNSTTSIIQV